MRNYDLNPLRRSSAGSDRPLIDGSLHDKGEDKCPPAISSRWLNAPSHRIRQR
jgi:hypothetical protein